MGSKILYYLVIIPISRLPYFLLYALSDFVYFILYYFVGYRKKVVINNMRNSFPDKSEVELKRLSKKFYRHFADLVLESLKNFTISAEEAQKRMKLTNPDLLRSLYSENKSIVIAGGHFNNWELWAVTAGMHSKHKVYGIYKKIKNEFFDRKMKESRGQFGLKLVSTREVKKMMAENNDDCIATVFAIDQSPGDPKKSYWLDFLNQETACYYGLEKHAKQYDFIVVYCCLVKTKRGFYEMKYEILEDKPIETEYGEIIEKANKRLEQQIMEHPEYWLWSHKRWKHKKPKD